MNFKILLLSMLMGQGIAKDLGVYGPVFEIKELNLLEVIQQRLESLNTSGKLHLHQEHIQKRVQESIKRPHPVAGIKTTQTYQAKLYDPTITVSQDLKDHQGKVFAHKGQRINPLDFQSFGKALVFINGDDPKQVIWALQQEGKIVLTQGKPLELEQKYQQPFYFDQGGALTNKFGIDQVPARVSQQAKNLLIEMMPPNHQSRKELTDAGN